MVDQAAPESPAPDPRIESGPVTFGSDWPGLFLRGDDALHYAHQLQYFLDMVDENEVDAISLHYVRALLRDLLSVHVEDDKVPRQKLRAARDCLMSRATIPGPPPVLNPWTDESWIEE